MNWCAPRDGLNATNIPPLNHSSYLIEVMEIIIAADPNVKRVNYLNHT